MRLTNATTCGLVLSISLRTPLLIAFTIACLFAPVTGGSIARSKYLFIAFTAAEGIVNPVIKLFVAAAFVGTLASASISVVEG